MHMSMSHAHDVHVSCSCSIMSMLHTSMLNDIFVCLFSCIPNNVGSIGVNDSILILAKTQIMSMCVV